MSAADKYLYADLTWPEVNQAVAMRKVILLPVGTTEQHGRHLPLDTDNLLPVSVCMEAGRRIPDKVLVAPGIPYGFNIHSLDFPGTVQIAYDHFIDYCTDVCKSLVYHGFKRIVTVNGHGSNAALLNFVGRRINLETDALVATLDWDSLLRMNPDFIPSVRESVFPGGIAHACELETSMYLHLAGDKVQMDQAEDHIGWYNEKGTRGFQWVDGFGSGPVSIVEWTSNHTPNGVFGQPTKATAEKGKRIFEETVAQLVAFIAEFQNRPAPPRVDHHDSAPSSPLPEF